MRLATTSLAALAALSTTDTGVLARIGLKSSAAEKKKPINKLTNSLRKATTSAVALTAVLGATPAQAQYPWTSTGGVAPPCSTASEMDGNWCVCDAWLRCHTTSSIPRSSR